jgi:hypothetical protein
MSSSWLIAHCVAYSKADVLGKQMVHDVCRAAHHAHVHGDWPGGGHGHGPGTRHGQDARDVNTRALRRELQVQGAILE